MSEEVGLQDVGFWSRFWSAIRNKPQLDKGKNSQSFISAESSSGEPVSPDRALKLSVVWACVGLFSDTVASLPCHLRDKDKKNAKNHSLYPLLYIQPNADMSAVVFWQAIVSSVLLWGNGYARINRSGNRIVSLELLYAKDIQVIRDKNGAISYLLGDDEEVSEDDMFHVRGFSLDGIVGLSAIQYSVDTLGGQIAANGAANKEFKNGLKVGGFLKTGERSLTKEQREALRESLTTYSRSENAGKYMVLEAGMDVANASQVRMNPADAQLLETRNFGIEEICRMFRVPPQLIGHTNKASSWASSLEQTNMGFLTYTLAPLIRRIEQEISRKLLSPSDRLEYQPKFSVNSLMRASSQDRAQFYAQLLQNGVMTRNEVRGLEDLPPVKGGDELTVQLNMTTIEELGKGNEA